MATSSSVARANADAILTLSKAAWKLRSSLPAFDHGDYGSVTLVTDLMEDVKSLGNECDLLYSGVEMVITRNHRGLPLLQDIDSKIWDCLGMLVQESSRTMQWLDLLVESSKGEGSRLHDRTQHQVVRDRDKDQMAMIRMKIRRQFETLRIMVLLLDIVLMPVESGRVNQELSQKLIMLRGMTENLQRPLEADVQSTDFHAETILLECTHEIAKSKIAYMMETAAQKVTASQVDTRAPSTLSWINTLEFIRRDQQRSDPSDIDPKIDASDILSRDEGDIRATNSAPMSYTELRQEQNASVTDDDSVDDYEMDVAKSAIDTGNKAFASQEWEEANLLLQEALQTLQQLPKRQRAFCDIFDVHYKLAICAYYLQEPTDAEEALVSLGSQSVSSDQQRGHIYKASHLLSKLYIRTGQIDRARSECEKNLQARRRLFGKLSDDSLESIALMAHIYALLDNRARAKSCLAMIPEARRDAIVQETEVSLSPKLMHLDSMSQRTRSISEDADRTAESIQNRRSVSSVAPSIGNHWHSSASAAALHPSTSHVWQKPRSASPDGQSLEDLKSVTVTSLLTDFETVRLKAMEKEQADFSPSTKMAIADAKSPYLYQKPVSDDVPEGKGLSREELLDRLRCQPKDALEDAACRGDFSVFSKLLNSKKSFLQSKLRKYTRPERVTALHFAALFGEIDMAQCLLNSNFKVNEIPHGYSENITPLKFAIGNRQVEMVEFLINNGARPSKPDSWSTLAAQIMNSSWLKKTMPDAHKESLDPFNRMASIFRVLIRYGWDINEPYDASGRTVLHQAVTFWTDSSEWDRNLRLTMTTFLYEHGADPFRPDREGKTPYGNAMTSGHHDLLPILDRGSMPAELDVGGKLSEPFELSSDQNSVYAVK